MTRWDLVYKWADPDTRSIVDAVTSALENCDRKLTEASSDELDVERLARALHELDTDEVRDAMSAAMQDHILDRREGWPHTRLDPPLNRENRTAEVDGCDDLCSDDIVDRLVARLTPSKPPVPEQVGD